MELRAASPCGSARFPFTSGGRGDGRDASRRNDAIGIAQGDIDGGVTSTVSSVDEASPNRSEIASPWKIGSSRMVPAPIIAANHRAQRLSLARAMADEVHQRTMMPASDEADHRSGGERGAEQPVAEHDADQRERDRRQDHQREAEAAELRHQQHIDAEDRSRQAGAFATA